MVRSARPPIAALALPFFLLAGAPASAAPIDTSATLEIQLGIQGVGPVTVSNSGTVDRIGSTVTVPAGLISLTAPIAVPVTGTTSIQSITATQVGNLAGTFSVGGVTNQAPGELCPTGGPVPRSACNDGGGIGGALGLTGALNIVVTPGVTVPLSLALIGEGGSRTTPSSLDAALWSTGIGRVALTTTTTTPGGTVTNTVTATAAGAGAPLTVVTPAFVRLQTAREIPLFGTLTLSDVSVPEPDTLLLLASGTGTLALLVRRRRR